jgi:2-dehydro-3-deoxygluconokinase
MGFNMDASTRALCFGEIMLRLSPPDHERIEQASSFDVHYGGAEANAALSLAFQGDRSSYVSVVPANRIGDCALRSISAYGVDVSRVVREGDRLGSYFFEPGASERANGCVYDRKYSALSLASHEAFDWDALLEGIGMFYFSGVTPAISDEMAKACGEALEACRAKGIATVCDLNYRSMWTPENAQRVMGGLLDKVDVCIANDEDAPSCLGISHGTGSLATGIEEKDEYALIARDVCERYGCRMVASVIRDIRSVEDSDWMGMVYANGRPTFSSVHHLHVLEGVASGDAFGGALMHGLLHGFDDEHLANYCIAASSLKLTIRGDSNLVTADEIEAVAQKGSGLRVAR